MKAKIKPLTNNSNYHFSSKKDKPLTTWSIAVAKFHKLSISEYYDQVARIIGNFARRLDLNVIKTIGTIKLRIRKMSGLTSHGTFISTDNHFVQNMHNITAIEGKSETTTLHETVYILKWASSTYWYQTRWLTQWFHVDVENKDRTGGICILFFFSPQIIAFTKLQSALFGCD